MKFERVGQWFKRIDPWHLAMAVVLAVALVALAVQAADQYRWSDWGFGDAQTMLSLRQWEEGGWFRNYFLFKPQGYAKVIELFDDPELRHHAHGTCPGSSPRVGPRLWYTHYPAGYLIPYAALFRIGLDSLFSVRMLSLLFSMGALVLMYLVFARITSPRVSFLAVLFYTLSIPFIGYADSLANQPIDDLLRFGFMLAVVLATRAERPELQKRWMIAAWVMEFLLSLTSFDSVFFIYAWLIGWDLLEKRGFRWRTYLVFALAPLSAHGLQFLQNVWYLGWSDAFIDIKDAFLLKHGADQGYNVGQGRLGVIITSIFILFTNLYEPTPLLVAVLAAYGAYLLLLRRGDPEMPSAGLLGVLFLCGLAFVLVLPHAARMPYEARQMIPFAALAAGGFFWSVLKTFTRSLHGTEDGTPAPRLRIAVPYLVISGVLGTVFWYHHAFSEYVPIYDLQKRGMQDIAFAQQLTKLKTRYEPVYFDLGGFDVYWDPTYVPGYPQILPLTEYYAGSRPILCFNDAEKVANDLITMVRKSPDRFSPIVIAKEQAAIEEVVRLLQRANMLSAPPQSVHSAMGMYALDLTDSLVWGR